MLNIVSTPIWNLSDITYRAVEVLKNSDIILCEDTRTSRVLLNKYDIKNKLISFHSYSKQNKLDYIIELLKDWKNLSLISDAGTPGFSDPWYILIKEALKNNIDLVPIPWVTAFATALSCSWMQMNHFLYLWFLPVKKWRQTLFTWLVERRTKKIWLETIVIYESVHRIIKTLWDIEKYFWDQIEIVIARELTKKFEEFKRGSVIEVKDYFMNNPGKLKGEFVIMF
jgi:16S rRNA (cytidine1402-2'-O)-methyltransferase